MARTCIICGGPTGSREHIFPAALGGRRTNKGIYGGYHNNAYSDLAGIISKQLSIFNAMLGVVGDHADGPTPVTMTDVASGREVEITSSQTQFKGPQTISETLVDGKSLTQMAFNTRKEADDWMRDQKAKGVDVQVVNKGKKTSYHVGGVTKPVMIGGTEEGMRAIGYIAQTFFAHSFPDEARSAEMKGIKDYTLNNVGAGFAWWDFDPPGDLPNNRFSFGHRVIVGLNKDDGTAYARISFFSALHFAVQLGSMPIEASRSVITDIDPLAKSPPNDIAEWKEDTAKSPVSRPNSLTSSLANAIQTGRAQEQITDVMRRISDFERDMAAARIMKQLDGAQAMSEADRDALFATIVSAETQRVLNLMTYLAKDLKNRAVDPAEHAMADFMEQATRLDPEAQNGLTVETTRALATACEGLAKQMSEDCKAGKLDQDRLSMLIGGGPGAHAVGMVLMAVCMQEGRL